MEQINLGKSELVVLGTDIKADTTISILEVLKNIKINKNESVLFFNTKLPIKNELNNVNVYSTNTNYIEGIFEISRKAKLKSNLKIIIVNDVIKIKTKSEYCLGQADVISKTIIELKKLAQELNVTILIPIQYDPRKQDYKRNPISVTSFVTKQDKVQEYVDRVIL